MDTVDNATHLLTVWQGDTRHVLRVPHGANLRRILLDAGLSPYTALTQRANCGGRGLCATCGVRIAAGAPEPRHWHDALAARWGYPRLSCQVMITHDLTVRLVADKWLWGGREDGNRDE